MDNKSAASAGRPRKGRFILMANGEFPSTSNTTYKMGRGVLLWDESEKSQVLTAELGGEGIQFSKQIFAQETMEHLQEIEYQLLYPVSKPSDRYIIYQDRTRLEEGKELDIGDDVLISGVKGLPSETLATIRFKGVLSNFMEPGIHFGLELHREFMGLGTSSGIFRKTRYFQCEENCGMFVTLYQIRRKPQLGENTYPRMLTSHGYQQPSGTEPVQLHEDIVWLSDQGPQEGRVEWLGRIQGLDPSEDLYAGISFKSPIGKGTGRFRGTQLFTTEKDHASLVPVVGLIRKVDFDDMSRDTPHSYEFARYPRSHEGSSGDPYGRLVNAPDVLAQSSRLQPHQRRSRPLDDEPNPTDVTDRSEPFNLMSDQPSGMLSSACSASTELNFRSDAQGLSAGPANIDSLSSSDGPAANVFVPVDDAQVSHDTPGQSQRSPLVSQDVGLSLSPRSPVVGYHVSTARPHGVNPRPAFDIQLGDYVAVLDPPRFGTVKWLSSEEPSVSAKEHLIAGLEMDSEDATCYTDGYFMKEKKFECRPHKAFFIYARNCRRSTRQTVSPIVP